MLRKTLILLFALLLVSSLAAEGVHHHDDGEAHDDCSLCVAIHHKSAAALSIVASDVDPHFTQTAVVIPIAAPVFLDTILC
jgi:hypothetical protein